MEEIHTLGNKILFYWAIPAPMFDGMCQNWIKHSLKFILVTATKC